MKSFFKRILRRVDLELRNFSIEKSENARFFTMLSHHKVNTIFDIGANEGQFGVILRDFGYKGKIISFEPLLMPEKSYTESVKMIRYGKLRHKQQLVMRMVRLKFNIAGNSESSSVLNMLDSHLEAAPRFKIYRQGKSSTAESWTHFHQIS